MKKIFDFEETVKYMHSIEVEIDETQEEKFEDFADAIAEGIEECGEECSRDDIVREFNEEFGTDKVKFCEDGSSVVKYEAI